MYVHSNINFTSLCSVQLRLLIEEYSLTQYVTGVYSQPARCSFMQLSELKQTG